MASKKDRRGVKRPSGHGSNRRRQAWWQSSWLIVAAAGGLAVILVGFALLSRVSSGSQPAPSTDPAVIAEVVSVDQSVTNAVGTGGLANPLTPASGGTLLTGPSGKPAVLYVGAEWCPYCAAERWSLVVALSRFGDFEGLRYTSSSGSDVYPNTPTLSFSASSFSSGSIDFVAVELADRDRKPLASPTAEQNRLLQTYDPQGGIPFVDIANRYIGISSGYQPSVLAGLSWKQIADSLRDPNSPVTRGIIGNANYLTAAICQSAGQNAAPACSWSAIQQIGAQLPKRSG